MEEDLHLGRRPHAIQLLLPIARRHRIVDEHDKADVEWLAPAHHDLAVDQTIVDAVQDERHRGAPPPAATIAALPRSSACSAASCGDLSCANTKSRSIGRFTPATSRMSGRSRRTRRAPMVQLPAWRSVKTTFAPVFSSEPRINTSRSAPLRSRAEIGWRTFPRPVICCTAETRPCAKSPCPASSARTGVGDSLIVLDQIAPHLG